MGGEDIAIAAARAQAESGERLRLAADARSLQTQAHGLLGYPLLAVAEPHRLGVHGESHARHTMLARFSVSRGVKP